MQLSKLKAQPHAVVLSCHPVWAVNELKKKFTIACAIVRDAMCDLQSGDSSHSWTDELRINKQDKRLQISIKNPYILAELLSSPKYNRHGSSTLTPQVKSNILTRKYSREFKQNDSLIFSIPYIKT